MFILIVILCGAFQTKRWQKITDYQLSNRVFSNPIVWQMRVMSPCWTRVHVYDPWFPPFSLETTTLVCLLLQYKVVTYWSRHHPSIGAIYRGTWEPRSQKIFQLAENFWQSHKKNFIQVKFSIHKNNFCSKLLLSALLAEIFFCPENFLCKLLAIIYYCIFFCTELIAEIFFWIENFLLKFFAEIILLHFLPKRNFENFLKFRRNIYSTVNYLWIVCRNKWFSHDLKQTHIYLYWTHYWRLVGC